MSFNQRGFTLAGALALIAVMSILLALAVPLWSRVKLRDNEEELIFRGKPSRDISRDSELIRLIWKRYKN